MLQEILTTAVDTVGTRDFPLYRRQASLEYLGDVGEKNLGTVFSVTELLDFLHLFQAVITDEDIAIIRENDEHDEGHKSTPRDVSSFFKDISKVMAGLTRVILEKQTEELDDVAQ